jgi:hypothetical protein
MHFNPGFTSKILLSRNTKILFEDLNKKIIIFLTYEHVLDSSIFVGTRMWQGLQVHRQEWCSRSVAVPDHQKLHRAAGSDITGIFETFCKEKA